VNRKEALVTEKIAAVTDDGVTISQHFGRAGSYAVVTIEDGQVVKREMRDKMGHRHFVEEESAHDAGQPHGVGPEARDRHTRMMAAIDDCQVLLARGMGQGARTHLQQAGIRAVLTDIETIDAAVAAYIAGELTDHPELAH
jgi:predicted Fe-Mo cluster-binding NifX family protein